jgi:Tripartite tricarboxylate transporter TctB family
MHSQRAAALAFLAVSVAYLALAVRIEEVVSSSAAVVGPREFPLLVGSVGVLVSLILLFAPRSAAIDAIAVDAGTASDRRRVFAGDWRRVLALCGLTLLYAAALPILGFTLATAGFLAASFRLLGERRFGLLVVVPVTIAVVCLVLLRGALGVYLPEPLLERLL